MSKFSLKNDLLNLCSTFPPSDIIAKYQERIGEGKLTIQENPESHFCVYFAAYSSKAKQVFIGHHKKSGLWLFNGGHIDEGETFRETLAREIDEEWGLSVNDFSINDPGLLTITEIDNPSKQTCRFHYDIWFFIDVVPERFKPDMSRIETEFFTAGWRGFAEARELVRERNTLLGIGVVEEDCS